MSLMSTRHGISLGRSGEAYSFSSNYITGKVKTGVDTSHKQNRL